MELPHYVLIHDGMKESIDIQQAIRNLRIRINQSDDQFDDWKNSGDDWKEPSWLFESCFLQLQAIVEVLNLSGLYTIVRSEFESLKSGKHGLSASHLDPDGDPRSLAASRLRCFTHALLSLFPEEKPTTVTKDLLQIIRDIHYVITDKELFRTSPADEADVHKRIEGILKPVFPDLKHKPTLTKQIKNFEPDTGIPSLETLVEYKFLAAKEDAPRIADELLADTRGYTSSEWTRFLYVIYETHRFKTEKDWIQLLRESGVPENTSVVVLSGEPPRKKRTHRNRSREKSMPK
jgi:hypothetical protein